MKLRIKGSTIRLRLSKPEVRQLAREGRIEEHTLFCEKRFSYAVESKTDIEDLEADFTNGKITVSIPQQLLNDWPENEIISLQNQTQPSNASPLYILVEKDFKCIDNPMEDQSDNYENPNKTC